MKNRFLVVDDDILNNTLCNYTISKVFTDADIHCFQYPKEGLNYILSEYRDKREMHPTILFLDINMPEINGWDFLDEFSKMSNTIHEQFTIYLVSSSIYDSDRVKAQSNVHVKDYLEKPLSSTILKQLVDW
ncbi:MAG: response regulator [Sphingobacteriaceae bacterium]